MSLEGARARAAPGAPKSKLLWLVAFRLAVASLLLLTLAGAEFLFADSVVASLSVEFSIVIVAIFGLSFVYGLLVWLGVSHWSFAYAQIAGDLVIVTAVVFLTGGVTSPFSFLYCMVIISAAFVLPRRATIAVASLAALGLLIISFFHVPADATSLPKFSWSLSKSSFVALVTQVIAFQIVAYLAASLSQEIQRTFSRLAETTSRLERLEDLHERVLLSLSSGIVTIDPEGQVIWANPAAAQILEQPLSAIKGQRLPALLPELARLSPDEIDRGEIETRAAGGKPKVLGISIVPLFNREQETIGSTLIFKDLTAIRAIEERAQLSERMATLGRLAAGIAHEIRNPLGSLSGSIELISQNENLQQSERALMAIVLREVARINALVTDFLDFAKPHEPDRVRFDIALLLREVLGLVENDAQTEGKRIVFEAAEPAIFIEADPGQVRQILWNLVKNGLDATPVEQSVAVSLAREGAEVVVHIEDHGPGISDDELSRVFEPFYTTKANGTGLGLAIVAQLIEKNRALLDARRAVHGGMIFEVRLAAAKGEQA